MIPSYYKSPKNDFTLIQGDCVETLSKFKFGFDMVFADPQQFLSGGGSKLNEVARSYSDIAPKINAVNGFEFVWITDGIGWKSAKNKLQEAFNIIPSIYNLTTIHSFVENCSNCTHK